MLADMKEFRPRNPYTAMACLCHYLSPRISLVVFYHSFGKTGNYQTTYENDVQVK